MRAPLMSRLLLFAGSVSACFMMGEYGVRFFGSQDSDGNFRFQERNLKPRHLPVSSIRGKIASYRSSSSPFVIYEPDLGWSPRPNSASASGLYRYNSAGIRSAPSEYSPAPQNGRLRIALFGDSYTHGDDVPFANTWGHYLETELQKAGIASEIINFGVGGYGIDQAFLRWKKLGAKYRPHVVVLGFQAENVARNLNLIRSIYFPGTGLPFSKPRFILSGERLELVNVPALPLEKIVDVMSHIESWDLVKYEYFYNPADYQDSIWLRSKLLSFVLDVVSKNDVPSRNDRRRLYSATGEAAALALRIIQEFKKDVEANGGKFLVVHLPKRYDLSALKEGGELSYAQLLRAIEKDVQVIHPEREMLEEIRASSLSAVANSHYAAKGNQIVAGVVEKFIAGHRR